MPLVYQFIKPIELLDKLKRGKTRLETAVSNQNDLEMADHLFNLAIIAFHIKDWLKELKGQNPLMTPQLMQVSST